MKIKKFYDLLLLALLMCLIDPGKIWAERIKIGVADFINKTEYNHALDQVTESFINILSASSSNIEVVRIKNLNLSDSDTEIISQSAKSSGCKYIVLGTLASLKYNSKPEYTGFLRTSIKGLTNQISTVLNVRLIDSGTGKIVLSESGESKNIKYKTDAYITLNASNEKIKEVTNKYNLSAKESFISASSGLSEKICAFLTGEYPKIYDVKVNSKNKNKNKNSRRKKNLGIIQGTLKINRGESAGISEGTIYRIFNETGEIFDFNGASLGHEKLNIAIAEVSKVNSNFSIAEVKGGNLKNIRDGDKAEQITQDEAMLIIEHDNFIKDRQ